jgi:phospholipid/cholesterol/gamma-HCH transport system permease protein
MRSGWDGGRWTLSAGGRWDLLAAERLSPELQRLAPERRPAQVVLDLTRIEVLDTVGALLLRRLRQRLDGHGLKVEAVGLRDDLAAFAEEVDRADQEPVPGRSLRSPPFLHFVERIGRATQDVAEEAGRLLNFFGLTVVTLGRTLRQPSRLRLAAIFTHMERVGLDALPIVGLLSFLIGVVLAFQGADQLRRFGAELFVVNLLGIGILREIGILMTSIIVAGRSGSAFTAQIGTMKVNQEVDAMQTMGLDPMELLVLPRVIALVITLPLLGFYADVVGLLGGALMSNATLGVTTGQFARQLQLAVTPSTLMIGLVKAPVFAFVIAMVGCYQGLKVTGSADSVGRLTTTSVVESIFLVIVLDALFSILFSFLGI